MSVQNPHGPLGRPVSHVKVMSQPGPVRFCTPSLAWLKGKSVPETMVFYHEIWGFPVSMFP